jgi:ribosome-interacting GTPase 1
VPLDFLHIFLYYISKIKRGGLMKIGLIGMPLSGKTTFFSLMTNIGLSGDQPGKTPATNRPAVIRRAHFKFPCGLAVSML